MITIGFCSPSTPITAISPIRFARAKQYLKGKGAKMVAGSLTGQSDHYRSGTISARAAEVNELIHNKDVDIMMMTIGGTNTNAILPYIDYEALRQSPKTIVGYSDATALLLAIKTQAPACRVLYGPALVSSFGEWPPFVDETWRMFQEIVQTPIGGRVTIQKPQYWDDEAINWDRFLQTKQQRPNQWQATDQTVLTGRIIGGNLNTMYGILASPYFPSLSKTNLLLIEDAEKDAATVEKNFAMLKNAGIFSQIGGIILGKHALFDDLGTGCQPVDILQEVLGDLKCPIIYDYDSCHTVPMMTTPLGAMAIIDADQGQVTFSDF
ncbi:S66 family peptidase [Furfurilactobacillus curtus]|uniref:LD-carboxypeptidase n=1 Tax=Furfurilactobacillus curtus TaxID=1746200 RepID=A0ABQ5JQ44_9LACO